MKVSVIGIGYVGAVTSACLASQGHKVIAVDKDIRKITCIEDGRSPIVEKSLDDLIGQGIQSGRLSATQNISYAVLNTDITLISVGTPSREDGSLNLSYVEAACREIGEALIRKDEFHSIVLRSTVIPGTAQTLAIPAIEKASGKVMGRDFGFAVNPEFLREGSAVDDFYNPPKIVIGSGDEQTADRLEELYEGIVAPLARTTIDVAEAVKYADNAWHAMKVGFANEIGNILKDSGVDSHKVMDVFFLDTKLNLSRNYLTPGFAFGGSCLPKDVRALRAAGQSKNLSTPILDALLAANDLQIERAYAMIRQTGKTSVSMLGLTFKSGTDDLRESPLLKLAEKLLADGYRLKIYDPSLPPAKSDVIESQNLREALCSSRDEDFLASEIFVIGNGDPAYTAILETLPETSNIIDLVRLKGSDDLELRPYYNGICW